MTDNLSKTIQKKTFSIADGQKSVDLTLQNPKRNENRRSYEIILHHCEEGKKA